MTVRKGFPYRLLVLLPLAGILAACESSSRIGSLLPGEPIRSAPRNDVATAPPPPLTPAPAGDVESSALPPPPGASTAGVAPPPAAGGLNPPPTTGTVPPPVTPQTPPPGANPANRVATAPATPGPAAPSTPSRSGLVGNWSMQESNGASCKVTLSSAPKLDLYGAGTTGCQNKELQRVNAWELAGSEVILYEPGGGVVARLRQAGGNYSGATAKSGAPLTMSK